MRNVALVISIVFSFYCANGALHVYAEETTYIQFKNFEKDIRLSPDGSRYRTQSGLLVELNHRVIVKTNKNIVLSGLISMDDRIIDGDEIFVAKDFNYYLLRLLKNTDIGGVINSLRSVSGVLLVQPDILQIGYPVTNEREVEPLLKKQLSTKNKNEIYHLGLANFAHGSEHHHVGEHKPKKNTKLSSRIYETYLKQRGVPELWKKTQGEGVRIAIIDDGIELKHPVLSHIKTDFIYDLISHENTLVAMADRADHGTKVAGVIFANHDDGGLNRVRGLAPKATLIALRNPTTLTSNTMLAFQLSMLANADIVNCSWNSYWLLQPVADVVNELAEHGRGGKGTAVIFSAGNEGILLPENSIEASLEKAIVVAAINPHGKRLLNSNYGESIDLNVYGRRVNSTGKADSFDGFAGTSLAASIVTGLAALILATQKDLSLDELQTELSKVTAFE